MPNPCKIYRRMAVEVSKSRRGRTVEIIIQKTNRRDIKGAGLSREQEIEVYSDVLVRAQGGRNFGTLLGIWQEWQSMVSIWCQLLLYQGSWHFRRHRKVRGYSLCPPLCQRWTALIICLPLLHQTLGKQQPTRHFWTHSRLQRLHPHPSQKTDNSVKHSHAWVSLKAKTEEHYRKRCKRLRSQIQYR